jgi:hypothetical protein
MAKTYIARAINGTETSATFYLKQTNDGPKLDRVVDLVVRNSDKPSKNGEPQATTSNAELGIFKAHNAAWLDETLKGFRVAREDGSAQIRVEVMSSDFLNEEEFNKADKY